MTKKEREEKLSFIVNIIPDWKPCQFPIFKDDCDEVCNKKETGRCDSDECRLKILQKLTKNS